MSDSFLLSQLSFILIIAELLLYAYSILGMSIMINNYLMRISFLSFNWPFILLASLKKISRMFGLNQQTSGLIIAIGNSIPEFCTNMAANLSSSSENLADFGLGAIFGSGMFGNLFFLSSKHFYFLIFHVFFEFPSLFCS